MQGIPRGWAPGGVLIGFVSLVGAAAAAPMSRPAAPANHNTVFQRQVLPLVQKYCINCHGPRLQSAEVGFHTFKTDQEFVQGRAVWEHASKRMASHQMPPRGAPQPTDRERQFLVTWIDTRLSAAECAVKDPGRVTLRRLNRAEYDNTLRDLLGIELKLSQDFPSDDVGYGFDNIGDVLTLSPLLMEKYLAAAEKAAAATIVTPEPPDPFLRLEAERLPADGATAVLGTGFRGIYSNGEVRTEIPLEKPGEYLVRIRAYGQQAGSDPVRMEVLFGGAEPQPFAVKAEARSPEVYEMRVRSGPGKQTLVVQYTNDFQDRFNPNPERRDRNLFLDYVEVAGPLFAADTPLPASHLRLIPVVPAKGQEEAAARTALRSFARRAYRRPVSEAEVQRLVNCVRLALKEGESYQRGMQLALQAALVSPNFLFRVELDPAGGPDTAGKAYPLNDHELACRLSYFLWSTMPDEELFRLAERGELQNPEVLVAQSMRLLRDPRSEALVENFATQWLTLRTLRSFSPDPKRFPSFNEPLREAMLTETKLFFASIMRENRSILDLLDGKYTFLNELLAKHYGIPYVNGPNFRRVTLSGEQRGGILTHASILTVTSNPTRTSPVKRGKWVLEQLLGTPPPPPPPNVPELKPDEGMMLTGTLRQKMEQHRTNPMCASCHAQMDAIGFGLENYDAVGAWRSAEGQFPVDASGTLPGGKSFRGPMELIRILKDRKQDFARSFSERLLTYAIGRGLQYNDRCEVRELSGRVAVGGYRFQTLIAEIVKSEPFRMRKGEGAGG